MKLWERMGCYAAPSEPAVGDGAPGTYDKGLAETVSSINASIGAGYIAFHE